MHTVQFTELEKDAADLLQKAVKRIDRSLNKVSNPRTSAIAVGQRGHYFGNNIFLSNCALFCAESMALAASVAAGDSNITKLFLAAGRGDTKTPKLITPCGNCCQVLHDFSLLNNNDIIIYITTSEKAEVLITSASELLPEGFKSASLGKMAN